MKNVILIVQQIFCYLVYLSLALTACPMMGQANGKKLLTAQDYGLWNSLHTTSISEDGNWITYTLSYALGSDTLKLRNTTTAKVYNLPGQGLGSFAGKDRYAYLNGQSLKVIDLKQDRVTAYDNVLKFETAGKRGYILITVAEQDGTGSLKLLDNKGKVKTLVKKIQEYKLSDSQENVVFSCKDSEGYSLGIIKLGSGIVDKLIIKNNSSTFSKLTWSQDSKAAAFQSVPKNGTTGLYIYNTITGSLFQCKDDGEGFPMGKKISENYRLQLRINNDLTKVFFGIEDTTYNKQNKPLTKVEVWHEDDKLAYPMRQQVLQSRVQQTMLACWDVQAGRVFTIGGGQYNYALLAGKGRYVLTSGKSVDLDDFVHHQAKEYYITDTNSGKNTLFLDSIQGPNSSFSLAPNGRYIAYFKDHNWWLYDAEKQTHHGLTQNLESKWDSTSNDAANTVIPYGIVGWTPYDEIVIYDENDIWIISLKGFGGRKITNGRGGTTRYRIANDYSASPDGLIYNTSSSKIINFKQQQLLTAYNYTTGSVGIYMLRPGISPMRLTPICKNAGKIFLSQDKKIICYEEQSFSIPPHIVKMDFKNMRHIIIAESNTQHKKYEWGNSEVITYEALGEKLTGVLIYPPYYDKSKKYPMVTYIYQTLTQMKNIYVNPSLRNPTGFNIANLSAKGYFILLPDITYRKGEPGNSAVACVEAAVKKAIATAAIDPEKIGLIGHSFGGYQTNFIVTKTNLFAAAISGAGVSDVISGYLYYAEDSALTDYWRYESQQFRIGISLYNDKQRYIDNSPVMWADNISTPLLTWAGKDDPTVFARQSMLMHAALRRLKKKNVLLLYPNEQHTLSDPLNQEDLTLKVEGWFDHYLKGLNIDWIEKDADN